MISQVAAYFLGDLQANVDLCLKEFEKNQLVKRLKEKDSLLWKNEPAHQKIIHNRLGWLDSALWLEKQVPELLSFAEEVKRSGFQYVVLLGMGGSSLAPEVFTQTFGRMVKGPKLIVLDSTDPDQVLWVEKTVQLEKTIFIVSTKSGTTLETVSFFNYFLEKLKKLKGEKAGENFVAITDSGTPLEENGKKLKFRKVFINPTNIGGRFSVLSYFGMVPFALMGGDVQKMVSRIKEEAERFSGSTQNTLYRGIFLGAVIGAAVRQKRDKLTFQISSEIHSFGLWIEQLISESLGKEGKGIVPIFGETLEAPSFYQNDRLFISIFSGKEEVLTEQKLKKLEQAGFPVIRIQLKDVFDLGSQFYEWAIATAVAGTLLEVNPFDEPNVQDAKNWTNLTLEEIKKNGKFLHPKPQIQGSDFYGVFSDYTLSRAQSLSDFLKLTNQETKKYISLCAYFPYNSELETILTRLRMKLRDRIQAATMLGFGPRYLHSTGQLHKGGPNTCLMILFTAENKQDAPIPGQFFSFSQLEYAQAVGDYQALNSKNRLTVRFHLKQPLAKTLLEIEKIFDQVL